MNTEPINHCPKCQAPVPPEAPQGLCPKCLLASVSAGTEGGAGEVHPAPPLEAVATAFPQLEILEFIGQGGMGMVYKARQPKLDRLVALKLLPQKPGADPALGERFNREARVLARLSHPNIVAVHDFGQVPAFFYLIMEFVDGVNLRQAMRAGRFTPSQAMALVPKICDALQYAHDEGVLHRDIKPENILLDARGRIKIADFGIAKLLGENTDITLTASGATVGTPHYMAPEQLERPQDVDQRADIYSLGVVFYEMLTGELPIGRFAPPSEKTTMDPRVDEVVMRSLEKERERRFQSAGEVKTRVENITANPSPSGQASTESIPPASGALGILQQVTDQTWSFKAIFAALLIALSVVGMGRLLSLVGNRLDRGDGTKVALLIGIPMIFGTLLGATALRDIRRAAGKLRGRRLAMFALVAGSVLLLDAVILYCLSAFSENLQGGFQAIAVIVGFVGIILVDVLLVRRWLSPGPDGPSHLVVETMSAMDRLPRLAFWGSGLVALALLLLLSAFRGTRSYHMPAQITPVEQNEAPAAIAGYEIPPGTQPARDGERTYRTPISVPAGYVLTVTSVLRSNQVPLFQGPDADMGFAPQLDGEAQEKFADYMETMRDLDKLREEDLVLSRTYKAEFPLRQQKRTEIQDAERRQSELDQQYPEFASQVAEMRKPVPRSQPPGDQPILSAFMLAPAQNNQPAHGQITWRLLGNTTLADGAPLEVSLAPEPDSGQRATIHVRSPEPLAIDWVSEPARVWPPPKGRTKFVIVRGFPPSDNRTGEEVEWTVGIELRVDPIPEQWLPTLDHVVVGTGTNWLGALSHQSGFKGEAARSGPGARPR